MGNLSVVIGADTSKFINEVKNAKATLDQFIDETKSASSEAKNNASVSEEQVQAYQKVIQKLQDVASGTKTAKQEQAALKAQLQELQSQWSNLSNEASNSAFGQSMSATISAVKDELASLKTAMANADNVQMSGNVKKQLRSMTNELVQLTVQYRAMSAAEKQSAGGQELAKKMDELRAKAGELKDTVGDVNTEITAMASDTPNLSAFGEILGVTGDLLSAHSSIIAKVTGDDKALKDAIATVMAVQTTYNAVLKIANAQETFANTLAKVRKIQEGAAAAAIGIKTAAEGKGVVVTKAATVAQAAFNTVAAMNPYVLIAMAIVGAVAAIATFVSMTDDATEAEKANAEAAKSQAEAYNNALNSSLENTIPKYIKLQEEWKNLRSEGEKKQWIEDNKSAFKDLGVEVTNVGDAENFLVTNTQAAMNAFMQRAKAAAMAAKANEIYKQSLEDISWLEEQRGSKSVKDDELEAHGSSAKESGAKFDHHGGWLHTGSNRYEIDVDKAIEARRAKAEAAVRELYQQVAKEEEKGQKTLSEAGIKTAVAGEKKKSEAKKKEIHKGSVEEAEEALKVWQQALNQADVSNEELIKKINEKIKAAEEEVRTRKMKIGIGIDPTSLQGMEDTLSKLKSDYRKGWRTDLDKKSFDKELKKAERAIRNKKIELGLKAEFTREMQDDLEDEIKEKEYELSVAVDEDSKKKISEELEKLLHMKAEVDQVVGIKGKVDGILVDEGELAKIADKVNSEFQKRLSQKYDLIQFPPDPTSGLTKWRKKAEDMLRAMDFYTPELNLGTNAPIKDHSLADQLAYEQSVVESLQSAYDKYIYDLQKTAKLTAEETQIVRQYVDVAADLSVAYENCENIKKKLKQTGGELTDQDREQVKIAKELAAKMSELKAAYDQLAASKKDFIGISDSDIAAIREYKTASANVQILTQKYKEASDQVYEFNRKAMISERTWDATKNGISIIGDLSSAAQNCGGAWKKMGEDWNKMTAFEKTTAVIDNTINSIESLISIYEKIIDTIKLFGEISELAAAKKVAANTAEMASDETKMATETANTQVKLANDTAETTSEIGKLGAKEAGALASATASGASLPFPANLAAIAAGIAAVVASFAMVFSAFEEGGIVGGRTSIGDYNLARVNKGEMILNGTQQKRLFNLLNGNGSRVGDKVGQGGEVTFHIKGNDLYGVLTNRNKKVSKI